MNFFVPTRPRRLVFALALACAVLASEHGLHAAPGPENDATAPKPADSVVQTTFKSVDATIAAQWEFPKQSPAPLVVLVPAGGRLDRNGWAPGMGEDSSQGIYAQLAKQLIEAGFAVFRYDKPGAGRSSPGQFATERSNALEAYTHAVGHARVDPTRVFLLGHSGGTDTVAAIYSRFSAVQPPAGVVFLNNTVGESESMRIDAPLLIVNASRDPDDRFQYGQFLVEARANAQGKKLETEIVLLDEAQPGLLALPKKGEEPTYTLDSRATDAAIRWLMQHRG